MVSLHVYPTLYNKIEKKKKKNVLCQKIDHIHLNIEVKRQIYNYLQEFRGSGHQD